MKLVQGNMLDSLENVRRYFYDNKASFTAVVTEPTLLKLDSSIVELGSTASAQNQHTRDLKGSYALQAKYRKALIRDHMIPIARIAKLELADAEKPELVKLTVPRKKVSVQQLVAAADGMAEAARAHAQVFIDAGRSPDFIDRLKAAAVQFLDAAASGMSGRARVKNATTGLRQKLSRARKVVQLLDALVKEGAGNDQALLESWKVAKRVRSTPSRSGPTSTSDGGTPAPSTPAAA